MTDSVQVDRSEVTGLRFLDGYKVLVSCHASGVVCGWEFKITDDTVKDVLLFKVKNFTESNDL